MTVVMNLRTALLLSAFAAVGVAHAQDAAGKTRAEVNAETLSAMRHGDTLQAGELGLTANQMRAQATLASGKTRADVQAELAQATRSGDVLAAGDAGLTQRDLHPGQYERATTYAAKTRTQVKAELAEAVRTGDVIAAGESGRTLRQLYPQRYADRALSVSDDTAVARSKAQGGATN